MVRLTAVTAARSDDEVIPIDPQFFDPQLRVHANGSPYIVFSSDDGLFLERCVNGSWQHILTTRGKTYRTGRGKRVDASVPTDTSTSKSTTT